jgi:FkbM family methyltransferase
MNNGNDTAYYLHRGYDVVAIEANPHLVDLVRPRFAKELQNGRLKILNVGIADVEGTIPFWICDSHSEWSSFNRNVAARDNSVHHEILVSTRRFNSIIEEYGVPYYLKVDIEGNDKVCLSGLKTGSLPEYVSVEASELHEVDLLAELGYTRFKCISQFHYLPLESPPTPEQLSYEEAVRALEARKLLAPILRRVGALRSLERQKNRSRTEGDWVFPFGSSGPFGENLLGRWQTHQEIRNTFETFQKMMRSGQRSPFWMDKEYSFWSDFHAAR